MGNYNPRSPYFLGEEMVTIRDYNLEPNPLLASAEYGSSSASTRPPPSTMPASM